MSTTDNLKAAFSGESMANRKYTAYAKQAEKEGFPQVAKLFRAIAEAETVHALAEFRAMGGIKTTAENLQDAMNGEEYEFKTMYPEFLAEAEKEGTNRQAIIAFRYAEAAEQIHYDLYEQALEAVKAGKDIPEMSVFVCSVCGHTHVGDAAPEKCPICSAAQKFYMQF
ncbi:MAG TPA: rubrerythrin family protein [Firmicutes bacterium]|jgi:rubrerythrin|nr:rubrerythrin family protein [Bacillota bacterium]